MPAADKLALDGTAKAVKGALRARGYGVVGELVAEPHVLKEILRNAGASGKGGAKGGPMQLFERWIALAVPTGATDLHIEVRRNVAIVRIRVDGRIEPLPDGQGGRYSRKEVVDAIAAGYNSTRKGNNVSQYDADQFVDCMIDLDLPGTAGQLRYQNVKGRLGPKTVVRILRTGDDNRIRFDAAGYAPSHLRLLRLAGRAGKGIVLLSGVTSSGKSTSLKSFIETLPGLDQKAIYTVEDPIEYEIAGAHQIEVLRDIANDDETRRRYAEVMRALMRSDPDGVMLGEIRDKLTALFALQIAETGHLAMGTVHAHLISNIIPRLTNDQIGVSRQALTGPNILNLLVYQALVPKLCRCCALPTVAGAARRSRRARDRGGPAPPLRPRHRAPALDAARGLRGLPGARHARQDHRRRDAAAGPHLAAPRAQQRRRRGAAALPFGQQPPVRQCRHDRQDGLRACAVQGAARRDRRAQLRGVRRLRAFRDPAGGAAMSAVRALADWIALVDFRSGRAEFYRDFAEMYQRNEAMVSFLEGEIANATLTRQRSRARALRIVLHRHRDGDHASRVSHLLEGVVPRSDAMLLTAVDRAADKPQALRALADAIDKQQQMLRLMVSYSALPTITIPICYALIIAAGQGDPGHRRRHAASMRRTRCGRA